MTVEEYLALDTDPLVKYEYLNGLVVEMAGASPRHNVVGTNLTRRLDVALEARPCLVFGSDQRVHVSETETFVYPDLTITCERPLFTSDRPPALLNPLLIIEVLSPSTRDHDRGAKLAHYRKIESVREVLLVESNFRAAELYRTIESARWLLSELAAGVVELESVSARLTFDEIYAKTDDLPLDPEPEPGARVVRS